MQNELAAHGVAADVINYPNVPPGCGWKSECRQIIPISSLPAALDRLKGGLLLLDAVVLIRRRLNRPLRVVFAGDGPDRQLGGRW